MNQITFDEFDLTLVPGSIKSAMKEAGATSRDQWQVPPSALRVMPNFNARITKKASNQAHIRSIADSIKSEGYYQDEPLGGYVGKEGDTQVIYVTEGHCRHEAVLLAISEGGDIQRVPVVPAPPGTSIEDLTVKLVRSNSGKPLEPYELAMVCKRLAKFGWDIDEIARRTGFTDKYVEGLLLLMGAAGEIRRMVEDDEVAASTAIEALRKYGDKALSKLQAALLAAKNAGGARMTRKHLPEVIFKKRVTKAAPILFTTMREVKSDPGYAHISPDLRVKLESLLAGLDDLEQQQQTVAAI